MTSQNKNAYSTNMQQKGEKSNHILFIYIVVKKSLLQVARQFYFINLCSYFYSFPFLKNISLFSSLLLGQWKEIKTRQPTFFQRENHPIKQIL